MDKTKFSNNKGLSLIELVVVIAIMAVMVGFLSLSLNVLLGQQAEECAEKVSARLDATKTGSMSHFNEVMLLRILEKGAREEIKSDGIYADNYCNTIQKTGNSMTYKPIGADFDPESRKMGKRSVKVTAYLSNGESYVLKHIDDVDSDASSNECCSILISYKRNTGALDYIGIAKDDTTTFEKIPDVYLSKLTFEQGIRTYAIDFVKATGKHILRRE